MEARASSTLSSRRVLVTGASGFIGSYLVAALSRLGADVTGLSRSGAAGAAGVQAGAKSARFVACDLRDAARTFEVVSSIRPQVVFHLAAHPDGRESGDQSVAVLNNNIGGVVNLLEAVRALPAVLFVYGDSAKVYGNSPVPYRCEQALEPLSAYAVSKVSGWGFVDLYRRVHGVQAVGLRPTLIYGPRQPFNLFSYLLQAVESGDEQIVLDGGAQTRDPIYIDDAVDAFISAAEHGSELNGRNLPLGGGREVSVTELAELTVRLLGGRQKVVGQPVNVRPTETLRSWCDNAEITESIGWRPAVALEEGIVRMARALGSRVAPMAETAEKI